MGGLVLVLGWSGGAGGRPGALSCSVALVFFKNNASHAAWRSFWAAGVAPAVGQDGLGRLLGLVMGGLVLVFGWSWGGLGGLLGWSMKDR